MATHTLTEREQEYLQHLQRADELEVTLRDYAAAYELDVQDLYYAKRQLTKKGALGTQSEDMSDEVSDFVPVRVASEPSTTHNRLVRLQHPSGWTLESTDWPPTEWLSLLLASSSKIAS